MIGIHVTAPDEESLQKIRDELINIKMPCGNKIALKQLPDNDIPCPCGNSNHWFVKYEKEDK